MSTSKPSATTTKIPEGFVSPFTRVEMEPNVRFDDGLCCVAMLTGQTLDAIKKLAYQFGFPEHGPGWVYSSMLMKILQQFDMVVHEKSATTVDALPSVALITAAYRPETEYGRWVLWHHVNGTDTTRAFHYAIDPAYWIPEDQKITTDFKNLLTAKQPIYYIDVTPKAAAKAKGK